MLDWINAAACLVLMGLTFPIAFEMRNDGHWPQRVTLGIVLVLLGLQVIQPISQDWLQEPSRIQTAFNVVLVLVVLSARKSIMALVRLTVGCTETPVHPYRRVSDISMAQMSRVHGKGKP